MVSHSAFIDGIQMRWEEQGRGLPVVLVHGLGTGPKLWRQVVPRLHEIRSLAWEMVGYGWSIPQGERNDISVGRQAAYLRAFLESLEIERAVFVGHDLGGGVIQNLAAHDPGRCGGLCLINSVAYDNWPTRPARSLRRWGGLLGRLPHWLLKRVWRRYFRRAGMDQEALELHFAPYARPGGGQALVRQLRSLDAHDTQRVSGHLSRLKVPTQIIWGIDDPVLPVLWGQRLAEDLSGTLVRVENAGHFVPETQPKLVAEVVNELAYQEREWEVNQTAWASLSG